MYYILFYKTVENYVDKRIPYRDAHLEYASDAHKKGLLMLGGALENPANEAVLVFKSDNPESAKDFARNDPYVLNGLIIEWEVRPWKVVIGEL